KKDEGSSNPAPQATPKVWQPGVDKLAVDEELQFDPSAYNCLHGFHLGWPCLSFDILRDPLGVTRNEFPHTLYCVAGTQAEKASWNSISIFKLLNVSGRKRDFMSKRSIDDGSEMESESSDSDDDDEEDSRALGAPVLKLQNVAHEGCVNRIRAMQQKPQVCASWSDKGHVQVWDLSSQLAMVESSTESVNGVASISNHAPLVKFTGHKDEGYAIDWSPLAAGRLVSGDCKNCIHLWDPSSDSTWNVDANPFVGHSASVEDLQWSPTESDVFASCSVDHSIAIWDIRCGKNPRLQFPAHDADVNVISWNSLSKSMIASGSDDGTFKIFDLRFLKAGTDSLLSHFKYHKHPITSIEWSPHENSMLAVSSADNQLTIWDVALERDAEEEAEFRAKSKGQANVPGDIPPELMFVHQGQRDTKELHWHSQIPGMVVSTSADGFNAFIPSNIDYALP
ncbi:hypothetical protein M569_00353, partial [Genlisea aurea]